MLERSSPQSPSDEQQPEPGIITARIKGTRRGGYQMLGVAKEYPTQKTEDGYIIETGPEGLLSRRDRKLRESLGKAGVSGFKIQEVRSDQGRAVLATPLSTSGELIPNQPVLNLVDHRSTGGGGFQTVAETVTGGVAMAPHVNVTHEGKVFFS